jgi:hypothetical protein
MKLDLLTNATLVDDAIRFVAEHQKESKTVSHSNHIKSNNLLQQAICVDSIIYQSAS